MTLSKPSTERSVLAVAALVVVAGVGASAWVATSASDEAGPRIHADVDERYEAVDAVSGTRTTTIERNGTVESERTYSVRVRPGTGAKRISLVSGTERKYETEVSNGSVLWLYDRDANDVTRLPLTGVPDDASRADRIERLFAALAVTGTDGETPADPPTVEPLPVVPASGVDGSAAGARSATFDVSYEGTETVAGREAHVLRVAPAAEAADGFEQTLWVDAEQFYPLERRTAWTADGERTVVTTTYEEVTFDPALDDDVFRPDVPENATLRTPDTPETTTYRSVEALRGATDVSVPDPDVPPTMALTYATRTTGDVSGVGLRYANDTSLVTLAKYDFTFAAEPGDERVTVDGHTAELTRGATVTLSWNCESYRYTVRGRGVSTGTVVDVARSVGCPGAGG